MSASRRPANITDTMRLIGAYCVVWYHNPFYWNLHEHIQWVDGLKLVFLGWSMPFFYGISARFAFTGKDFSRRWERIVRLGILVIFYTLLYEFFHRRNPGSLAIRCLENSGTECSAGLIFDTLRNVGNTPGYYLSDLIVIYLLAIVVTVRPWLMIALASFASLSLFMGWIRLGGLFLNPLGLFGVCAALGYLVLIRPCLAQYRNINLKTLSSCSVIMGFILVWGCANLLLAQNQFWNGTGNILLFLSLLMLFMGLSDLIQPEGRYIAMVSEWGRKYAFGIFIFHQLCFDLLAPGIARIMSALTHSQDMLPLFVVTGLVVSLAATVITVIIRKAAPALLTP